MESILSTPPETLCAVFDRMDSNRNGCALAPSRPSPLVSERTAAQSAATARSEQCVRLPRAANAMTLRDGAAVARQRGSELRSLVRDIGADGGRGAAPPPDTASCQVRVCVLQCCNALWRVATRCAVLQRAVLCCNVLCRVATRCRMLQRAVLCCNALCCVATRCGMLQRAVLYCNALRCVATRCGVLQRAVACCNALCCVATRCAVLQRAVLCCNALCCAATRCGVLQRAVLCCSALCCAATRCAVLQRDRLERIRQVHGQPSAQCFCAAVAQRR
jgi:hypothetical protein